ncbi:MAG: GNAT family N-acetyltransferase [Thermomicrobiales bacterium]
MNETDARIASALLVADSEQLWQGVLLIRRRVFADEQGLVDLGITDGDDAASVTLVAMLGDQPVSTGRLTPPVPGRSAYLSWIATLAEYRGRGIATKLVERLVATSDSRGYPELQLASQAQAVGLYAQFGFERLGRPYVVRGIPHQAMARSLRIGR